MITKIRGVSRFEVGSILAVLIPELEENLTLDINDDFKRGVSSIINEMNQEIDKVSKYTNNTGNNTAVSKPKTSKSMSRSTSKGTRYHHYHHHHHHHHHH